MTVSELRACWAQRRDEWCRLGIQVDGAKVCEALLKDLDNLVNTEAEELLTLTAAARETGLRPDSIGRAVRDGRLPNHGRRNAPRVRRADLAKLRTRGGNASSALTPPGVVAIPAMQIARAVVTSSNGGRDG